MTARQDIFLRCGRELDRLTLAFSKAVPSVKLQAYKDLERRLLKEARTAFQRREIQRRITEGLLRALSSGPWDVFEPILKRIERLGYSTLDRRVFVCVVTAEASKGSVPGVQKTKRMISDIEQRAARLNRLLPPRIRLEIIAALGRARQVAGIRPESEGKKKAPGKPEGTR
jgi:hypothetical protein